MWVYPIIGLPSYLTKMKKFNLFFFPLLALYFTWELTRHSDCFIICSPFAEMAIGGMIVAVVAIFVMLVISYVTKKSLRRYIVFCILFVIVSISSAVVGFQIANYQGYTNKQNAIKIIGVMDKYFTKTHAYPDSLQQLIPEYSNELPKQWQGINSHEFYYERIKLTSDSMESYNLTRYCSGSGGITYFSKEKMYYNFN